MLTTDEQHQILTMLNRLADNAAEQGHIAQQYRSMWEQGDSIASEWLAQQLLASLVAHRPAL